MDNTHTNLAIRSSLALALALAIWSPAHAQSPVPAEGKTMTAATMMERCQEMKQQKQNMKDDIKAQDAKQRVSMVSPCSEQWQTAPTPMPACGARTIC